MSRKRSDLLLRSISFLYIGILIILPIFAIIFNAFDGGIAGLWENLLHAQSICSLRLTLISSLLIVLINVFTGTLTAWVLVRYRFPFKNILDAIIDIPFAIPTVVTGIMLVILYGPNSFIGGILDRFNIEVVFAKPGIILALLFVTFPFVIRSVQPVLIEMEPDMEEAAKTLGASNFYVFKKIVFPGLIPSILTGAALSFSRAIGEFGSIVLVAGNIPFKTQVASVYIYGEIESYNRAGALSLSLALLLISFFVLLILNLLQRWNRRYKA